MTGDEFRARRMALQLYQGHLAEQLQTLGLMLPGDQKIDQPAISMMERGKLPIPAEVAAALLERVTPGADAPPPVGQPRASADGQQRGGKRKRVARKSAEPPAAAVVDGDGVQAGAVTAGEPQPPPAPAPDPQVKPPAPASPPPAADDGGRRDRPPVAAPAGVTAPRVTWDEAAKSQLESDLRDVFAGQRFLVPVRTEVAPGEYEIRHQEGFIPGVAQAAGLLGGPDDERAIVLYSAAMARAWADLADENTAVRRFLMGLTYGGAWRGVIAATLPCILAIAGNHGLGLPSFLGGASVQVPELTPQP